MRVVMADSLGMCFGVRDAVELALSDPRRSELTILGELVHNPDVLRTLRDAGVRIAPSVDAMVETGHVMITAHGTAPSVLRRLHQSGMEVVEATCPLVAHAHRMVDRLQSEGYYPVIIGRRSHVEVQGLVADLTEYEVIESLDQVARLAGRRRLGIVSQTTQPIDFVLEIVRRIRETYPDAEVRFFDTVCQPTKDRQAAARRLAAACEVVVVVGGRNSNNTRQLARTCGAEGARVYQIERPEELQPDWFAGVETVGLTAGTSTPDEIIEAVGRALQEIGAETLHHHCS
jgi:4-hydroxy-3-methylbut-2-en-1-yl diphosphate reductase